MKIERHGALPEQEVTEQAVRRAAALAARDEAALRRLMHPGLQWTTFRGEVLGYADYVEGSRVDLRAEVRFCLF